MTDEFGLLLMQKDYAGDVLFSETKLCGFQSFLGGSLLLALAWSRNLDLNSISS